MDESAQRTEIGRILAARSDMEGITQHNVAARKLFDGEGRSGGPTEARNYDVATDITPEMIDDRSDKGNKMLAMWRKLIGALSSDNRYVMLARIEMGPDPTVINDGIAETPTAVLTAYIRIFENGSPADLRYVKGAGDSFVALDGLHTTIKVTFGDVPEVAADTVAIIAAQSEPEADGYVLAGEAAELELDLLVASADDPTDLYNEAVGLIRAQLPSWEQNARDMHVKKAIMDWAIDQERASQQ